MYDIKGLVFEYDGRRSVAERRFQMVLDEFCLDPGEKLAVVGPNGSGKTTLLRVLAFLEKPSSYERFVFKGQEIGRGTSAGWSKKTSPRSSIGLLRQHPWIFRGTVSENLAYPLRMRGWSAREISVRVGAMCERLLLPARAPADPRSLSGGEQKRVALGRVLIAEPEILLLDEPMAHLDRSSRKIIAEILTATRTCAVFTTHDLQLALGLADRTLTLKDGGFCPEFLENVFGGACENGTFLTRRGLLVQLPSGASREAGLISVGPGAIRILPARTSSALSNAFPGRLTCIRAQGETVWLEVDAGETFVVSLSRSSYEQMCLNLHGEVMVHFPVDAVRVL